MGFPDWFTCFLSTSADGLAGFVGGESVKIVFVTIPGVFVAIGKELRDSLEKRILVARPDPLYLSAYERRARPVVRHLNFLVRSTYALSALAAFLSLFLLPPAAPYCISWTSLSSWEKLGCFLFVLACLWGLLATLFLLATGYHVVFGKLKRRP